MGLHGRIAQFVAGQAKAPFLGGARMFPPRCAVQERLGSPGTANALARPGSISIWEAALDEKKNEHTVDYHFVYSICGM